MSLVYQTIVSPANVDTTVATGQGIKIVLPLHQNLKVVEYGCCLLGADPTGAVVALQYVDGAASPNTVTVDSFTVPAAAADGDLNSHRVDAFFDKLLNLYRVSTRTVADPPVTTPGSDVSDTDGIVKVQLNLTTGVAATTGTFYIVCAFGGTNYPGSTSQNLV